LDRWAQIAKHLPGRTDNEVKNFWNSCIKKKILSRGIIPPFTPFSDIHTPFNNNIGSKESFFPINANPNVILNFDNHHEDQLCYPTSSPNQQGIFHQIDTKVDMINNHYNDNFLHIQNPIPEILQPMSNPSPYEDTWSLGSVPLHLNPNQENQISKGDTTPLNKIINPIELMEQYVQCHDLVELESTLPKLVNDQSLEDYPQDQNMEANQFIYINDPLMCMSSLSSSSSQIVTNPTIPLGWEP